MKRNKVGIDSNALTYLIQGMTPDYQPNQTDLSLQVVSLLRIYLYTGEPFYVVPTVKKEYMKIKETLARDLHKSTDQVLCNDVRLNKTDVFLNTAEYLRFHNGPEDCRILAEAEVGGLNFLLTGDNLLLKHLGQKTKTIHIIKPSDYWNSLRILKGDEPILIPHETNPLYGKKWWRW